MAISGFPVLIPRINIATGSTLNLNDNSSLHVGNNATLTLAAYATLTLVNSALNLLNASVTLGLNSTLRLVDAHVILANSTVVVSERASLLLNRSAIRIINATDVCLDFNGCIPDTLAHMDLVALQHWFLVTGILAMLVVVMGLANLYAFHRQAFMQTIKSHFHHVTLMRARKHKDDVDNDEVFYANPVGMMDSRNHRGKAEA